MTFILVSMKATEDLTHKFCVFWMVCCDSSLVMITLFCICQDSIHVQVHGSNPSPLDLNDTDFQIFTITSLKIFTIFKTGLWLVESDQVTWILASDCPSLIRWPEYWPVIGQHRSRDLTFPPFLFFLDTFPKIFTILNTELWLGNTGHVTLILASDWSSLITWP